MNWDEAVRRVGDRSRTGELNIKRVACAHCGNTWLEMVGLVVGNREGFEDLYLRVGMESENCQLCRFRISECQKCNSKDVYEISFPKEIPEYIPLSFKDIKKISRA